MVEITARDIGRGLRVVGDGIFGAFSGAQDSMAEKTLDILFDALGQKKGQAPVNNAMWSADSHCSYYPTKAQGEFINFTNTKNSSSTRAEIYNNLYGFTDGLQNGVPANTDGFLSHVRPWSEIKKDPEAAKQVLAKYNDLLANAEKMDYTDNKWSRAAYIMGVYMELPGMPSIKDFHQAGKAVVQDRGASDAEGLIYSSGTWTSEAEARKILSLCQNAAGAMDKDLATKQEQIITERKETTKQTGLWTYLSGGAQRVNTENIDGPLPNYHSQSQSK